MSSGDKDRKKNVSEKDNYLITTLKRIIVTCDKIKKRMDKLVAELRKFMKKYPDVISQEEVELFKQNVAETRSTISINQSRVAPLLRIDEERITSDSDDSYSESSDSDSTETSSNSRSGSRERRRKKDKTKGKKKVTMKKSKGGNSAAKGKKKKRHSGDSESECLL
ncbi:hypothetical protein DFJ73DRAFT_959746 [Zopfochytrium polystomum]|nr:hypothetical protein DFJ73DRAFT_959746 [Zopfochytrium polystomum]